MAPLPSIEWDDIRFNPRPAVRPGEITWCRGTWHGGTCFNPRPAVRPGEISQRDAHIGDGLVSIRARP